MNCKLLIVEDHLVVKDGLIAVFAEEENIKVVGDLNDGDMVMPFLSKTEVDLILLDINLPGTNGLTLAPEIKKKYPKIKILVLTFYEKSAYIKSIIESGAEGYLLKNSSKEEVLTAIEIIMSGKEYFSKQASDILIKSLQTQGTDHIVKITKREVEIMILIAKEYTSGEIAEKLFISSHTAETHRKNLIGKLNVKNSAGLVRYAVENGYLET